MVDSLYYSLDTSYCVVEVVFDSLGLVCSHDSLLLHREEDNTRFDGLLNKVHKLPHDFYLEILAFLSFVEEA